MEADYGSDHELLIAKFRLKLKKVGKTTGWFSYELNQIPYDYSWTDKYIQGIRSDKVPENYGWKLITLYRRWW